MTDTRLQQTSTATSSPPGAGGWVPNRVVQVALSAGAACLVGGGTYLSSLNVEHPFSWQGLLSACVVGAGGALATFFGIGSAGPRKDTASRFPPQD